MASRVVTALLGLPIFLAIIYFGGLWLQVGLTLMVIIGLYEFRKMFQEKAYWDYLLVAGLSLLVLTYTGLHESLFLPWFFLQLIYFLIRSALTDQSSLSQSWHMIAVFYVAGLFSFLWLLHAEFDIIWIFFGLVVTWATDTFAYFIGIKFGKTKLAPSISPKKTIEGSLGGIAGACIVAIIYAVIFHYPVSQILLLAICLSIAGQIGDLVESSFKREREVKDSGSILPGHGGILDRFDSVLFVIPTLYFILKYLLT